MEAVTFDQSSYLHCILLEAEETAMLSIGKKCSLLR